MKKDFDERFKQAIELPPIGPTAGRMARFFAMLRGTQTNYTSRATQERLFLKYLHCARPEQFTQRDLCDVCRFLGALDKNWAFRSEFITVGARQFPDCARLQLLAGDLAMEGGPFACDFLAARSHMQRALELARDSRQADDEEIVERAQQALALLDGIESHMSSLFDDDMYEDMVDGDPYLDEVDEDAQDEEGDDDGDDEFAEFDGQRDGPLEGLELLGDADLEQVVATLPPDIAASFRSMAAARGVTLGALIRDMLDSLPLGERSGRRRRGRRGK